ncbi:MAG TPA: SDR family oxidoreductase [Draconibacterium sp.]|nr:SDR family oxidoreductase [Draconibacterium sp.]
MKTSAKTETALITGGSSGIGYAIAKELASRGFNLILASNQEEKLNEVCKELTIQYQIKAWPVFIDLAETGAAQKLYYWCQQEKIEIEILINNAGIFFFGEVVETNPEKVQQMITLHTTTPSLLCTLFGHDMKKRRSGHILNISSLAAWMPYPGISHYSSTKQFLKSFSRSLRTEMIDYNVNVTCICPGAVSTQLYELSETGHKKALKTGIMMSAERLAKLSVNGMFKRKSILVPGFVNRIFLLFIYMLPHGIVLLIRRYSRFLPPDRG